MTKRKSKPDRTYTEAQFARGCAAAKAAGRISGFRLAEVGILRRLRETRQEGWDAGSARTIDALFAGLDLTEQTYWSMKLKTGTVEPVADPVIRQRVKTFRNWIDKLGSKINRKDEGVRHGSA